VLLVLLVVLLVGLLKRGQHGCLFLFGWCKVDPLVVGKSFKTVPCHVLKSSYFSI
jgi:hypothetical protein